MHSIKRIGVKTLVYARKHNVKKKTKDLMAAITISTAGTGVFYQHSKILPELMADEFLLNGRHIAEPAIKKIKFVRTKTFPYGFDWSNLKPAKSFEPLALKSSTPAPVIEESFVKKSTPAADIFESSSLIAKKEAAAIEATKQMIFNKKVLSVTRIMNEDKSFTSHNQKDKIAAQIVRIAQKYEINPVHIACIAKKESHLTPNLNGKTTKGMMQITMGAVRPMYKYPQNFSPKLNEIKKFYPTAEKLFDALGKNPELNLEIGTIYFKTCLKLCKGNLKKALEMYNNSSKKEQYARDVIANIKKYS